jgi:hypothetical protein
MLYYGNSQVINDNWTTLNTVSDPESDRLFRIRILPSQNRIHNTEMTQQFCKGSKWASFSLISTEGGYIGVKLGYRKCDNLALHLMIPTLSPRSAAVVWWSSSTFTPSTITTMLIRILLNKYTREKMEPPGPSHHTPPSFRTGRVQQKNSVPDPVKP